MSIDVLGYWQSFSLYSDANRRIFLSKTLSTTEGSVIKRGWISFSYICREKSCEKEGWLFYISSALSPTEMTFGCRKQTAISKKEIADCSVINKVIFWHNKKVSSFPSFIFPNCSSSELISSSICYYSLHFLVHYFSSNSFA
jgi:hypothetical protein